MPGVVTVVDTSRIGNGEVRAVDSLSIRSVDNPSQFGVAIALNTHDVYQINACTWNFTTFTLFILTCIIGAKTAHTVFTTLFQLFLERTNICFILKQATSG